MIIVLPMYEKYFPNLKKSLDKSRKKVYTIKRYKTEEEEK